MDAASLFLGRKLVERIEQKQQEMLKPLINGKAVDFADYKDRAGYLRGLNDVITWMEEITAVEEERV